jgi:1-acyl-sn-glycerol-3-phosphate acyltransferase
MCADAARPKTHACLSSTDAAGRPVGDIAGYTSERQRKMTIKDLLVVPVRVALTAYGFIQFAVQVLWLGNWQMPRIMRRGDNRAAARRTALYAAHRHVVVYLKTLSLLKLVKFRFEGTPHADPCVVVANHPSLLDFIVFLKDLPNTVCLYKAQSLDNPVLSSFLQVAGYIEGMDGSAGAGKRIIADCCERLGEGHHVAFFPEGTRSESATAVRKFRTTAFHAVVRAGSALQPVAIYCRPLFLGKNQKWLAFCRTTNHMTIRYLPVIHLQDLPADKRNAAGLADAARQSICSALEVLAQAD